MTKQKILSFLKRFLFFNVFVWGLIGISIPLMVGGPTNYSFSDSDWDDFSYVPEYNTTQWNVLFDPHSHTKYSEGHLTPRQNLLWHIAMGFNAIALTDHNTFAGIEETRQIARTEFNDSIKVLIGVEWTTSRCHLNLIFPPNASLAEYENIIPSKKYTFNPTDEEIQQVIQSTRNLGGIVIVNHFLSTERMTDNHPTRQQYYDWSVDYFEIINEDEYDDVTHQFCLDNGLGIFASTDMHEPEPVYSWTMMNSTEFSEEAIFNELTNRRTGFFYDSSGSPYDVEHKRNKAYVVSFPLIKFGEFFKSMYSSGQFGAQLAVFLVYIYGSFLLFEGYKILKPRIEKMKLRKKT
ncbi:MAG: PHP domain-containing protein [Candidatus Heimdallarchaeota archaeon]